MTENRQSWLERDPNEERHKGSYDLEFIKSSDAYERRIEQQNAVKRKYAICFGYLGSKYQGLQINPGADTVEKELERAVFLAGGIQECNFGYLHKVQFSRAARTDRGVHAVTQCCALKLSVALDRRAQFIEEVNSFLPEDIRALTMTKVSKGFNAKSHCTKRRYHYLLPTYALQPHADLTTLLQEQYDLQGPVMGAGSEGGYIEEFSKRGLAKTGLQVVYDKIKNYRTTAEEVQRLRDAVKTFEGTRAYHNFTTGKLPSDANAKRFIISFECGEPFVDQSSGVEWVLLTVLGQSFLLNQIRKMVGMAVEVCRGATPASTIHDAFTTRKMELPMAPSLGLYLGELFFDGYNNKQRKEIANDKRLAAIRAEKMKNASNAVVVETATEGGESACKKARPNPPGELAASAQEDDGQSHEEIAWSTEPETVRATTSFRDNVIHPHVFQQDGKTLDFMYYFDFVRAYPKDYASMTATHSNPSNSSAGTSSGRPPAVKVVRSGEQKQQQQQEKQDDYEE